MKEVVIVCTDRECRHLHDHVLIENLGKKPIWVCIKLDVLEDTLFKKKDRINAKLVER